MTALGAFEFSGQRFERPRVARLQVSLAHSAVFCAQHRLSHKLMLEAAATRKHLQVQSCMCLQTMLAMNTVLL